MPSAFTARHATDTLLSILGPMRQSTVVDIGASPVEADPPYAAMLSRRLCTVTGFEPLDEPRTSLAERKTDLETYFPDLIGDGEEHTLHLTILPSMTSLFEPDQDAMRSFPYMHVWGHVKEHRRVPTRRLDDIDAVAPIDLLKIDAQGSELMVLRGGRRKLGACVAIHAEVPFVPLYRNQPTLGDIDAELRSMGMVPHTFTEIRKRLILPMRDTADPFAAFNQIIKADAVYVRDFTRPDHVSDEEFRQLAVIALVCYGSVDLTAHCLMRLTERGCTTQDAVALFMRSLLESDDLSAA